MKSVGLFFGSFNPIHLGHLIVAEHCASCYFDEVWLVVSPQNPLKDPALLADQNKRLEMVRIAIGNNPRLVACDVEFSLSYPSYTINTLAQLRKENPSTEFSLILGEDLRSSFHLWQEYLQILSRHKLYFFPRHAAGDGPSVIDWTEHRTEIIRCPRIEISSTYIRQLIKEKKSIKYLVTDPVQEYISLHGLYR